MRVWRGVRRGILVIILVLPTGILGTVLALGWSPPGRRFTSRLAEAMITEQVAGRISIGRIDGNLINHIILEHVVIQDSLQQSLIEARRIEAHYDIVGLIRGRGIVFSNVLIDSARVHLVRTRRDRWNYQDIFHSGLDTTSTTRPPLVQLNGVTLRQLSLRVDVPTVPKPAPVPISRNSTPQKAPTIIAGADGPVRVYTAENLEAKLSLIRVSTPANDPILVKISALSTTLSDPAVIIRDLQGEVITAADSLRFTFQRAAMPATVVHGAGAVRWPRDTVLFDFALDADTVDLKDLRWVSPDFPDWQGRGKVVARSQNESRTAYQLDQLRLGDGRASAAGSLTAIVDLKRGLGMRDLKLALRDVPLMVARPYLDTLPFAGLLNGPITADGFLDTMHLGGDLVFSDALVDGTPRSHFVMDGTIHFGGPAGAVFDDFELAQSAIDLGTVRRVVPALILPGTLSLAGRLDGPWQNVKFTGTTEHLAPDQSRSRMVGMVRLDTRDTLLAVDVDGDLDQLSFDALRSGYPSITARGGLTGHLKAQGRLDSLTVDAALSGEIGTFHATGNLRASAPNFGTDSLLVTYARLNAEEILGKGMATAFNGQAVVHGGIDSTGTPSGRMVLTVDPSRIGSVSFEGALVRLHTDSGLVVIDSLQADLPEGWIDVTGNLGLDSTHAGTLLIDAGFRTLAPFDSLARAYLKFAPDTIAPQPLSGTVHGTFTVTGSVSHPSVDGTLQVRQVKLDRWHLSQVIADIRAEDLGARMLEVNADGDSLGQGGQMLERTRLRLSGRLDSLRIGIDGHLYRSQFAALGSWQQKDSSGTGRIDSLALNNLKQQWRLKSPIQVAWADGRPAISDTATFQTTDGSGQLTLSGALPGRLPGDLTVSGVGLDIQDLSSVVQRDSSIYGGLASIDLRLAGTADAPTLHGTTTVTGPTFGDVGVPLLRASFDYADRRLQSQLTFWRTGNPLLEAKLSLPFDLAFSAKGDRKLPGAIDITARADSADLALLEAFTTSVRSARGTLNLDMRATGSWQSPRLGGVASITDGALVLPDLGVEYRDIDGRIHFAGDSMVVDSLTLLSKDGSARLDGMVRFQQLTTPSLALNIRLNNFLAMDVPAYLTAEASGNLTLRGPLTQPLMAGSLAFSHSVLYYADLVNKTLVDIEDPAFADLVDTALVRRQGLGASFQNRFINALRIDPLHLRVNEDVWLRSAEANIQLTSEGDVTVRKQGKVYDVQGTFNADRGTYNYSLRNVVNKEFKIQRGTVSFFGTSDLNAAIDLEATHTVHTQSDGDVEIVARIDSTIRAPRFRLTSPGRNLPEIDLVSLLIFKERAYQVNVNQKAAEVLIAAALSSQVSSTLNEAVSSQLGLGIEVFGLFDPQKGVTLTQEFGSRTTLTASASLCQTTGIRALAAAAEYRLGHGFRIQSTVEPVDECLANGRSSDVGGRRNAILQVGLGLFWKRDY